MSDEVLVNVGRLETRVALIEDGVLQDVHMERAVHRGLTGNIYNGKVVRVLPGMQAAFVDIGAERNGFIHAGDIPALDSGGRELPAGVTRDIRECVREGQQLLVQVAKEPLGDKGARLTTRISIASRYLVYLPRTSRVAVSQQITADAERERLLDLLQRSLQSSGLQGGGGYILRTVAEGVGAGELESDLEFLRGEWRAITEGAARVAAPGPVRVEWRLHQRALRDLARSGLERIRVDDPDALADMLDFCRACAPELAPLLELDQHDKPLFDRYGIEEELDRALARRVELKSGGYLVIDQTEAMTTIDVNTGAYVGRDTQEDTVFQTNQEAARALARQLRLRNLGGIIIVDFIDMADAEHRRQVLRTLEKAMAADPARSVITGVSELGLVEMTRARRRKSLGQFLCEPCPVCDGRGRLKSAETISCEIMRDILRAARGRPSGELQVAASPEVVDRLLDEDAASLADVQDFTGKTVQVRVEPMYSREQFDIIPL